MQEFLLHEDAQDELRIAYAAMESLWEMLEEDNACDSYDAGRVSTIMNAIRDLLA